MGHELDMEMEQLAETGRNLRSSFRELSSSFRSGASDLAAVSSSSFRVNNDDEVELQWAAIQRLPTFTRLRMSLFDHGLLISDSDREERDGAKIDGQRKPIDVTELGALERHVFMEKLITKIEDDNLCLLKKLKERSDRVGLELSTIEVRFQNLSVEADCEVVQGKPIPTLWNTITGVFSALTKVSRCKSQSYKIKILKDISGIIKPSRMTLLLGPPGCGKTTLLQALSGKLNPSLKVTGEISYNGYKFTEFVPQNTSAYISQYDLHISEMTVRETLDFSARCQGIGTRADILKEISRREKQSGIVPEPDIDTYMKAISIEGLTRTLQTDYILKILGLDICADTIVGDAMNRGISGGQKRRLTTGEMIVGPNKALFMDEISTGLDSSTTFQIVTCLQQLTHITEATLLVSLLQPAPETFDLFDDIILMTEGKIVYNGPRSCVQEFFEHCGFRCPERKGVADFLQEVLSKKDQGQYWYREDQPHSFVSVDNFIVAFKKFHTAEKLNEELCTPFKKSESHKNALSFNIYSLGKWELLKACMAREWLLMKRNSFVHVFKSSQLIVVAIIAMTIFIRTRMKIDLVHASYYLSSLFYALIRLLTTGIAELSLTVSRLSVFYRQRDFYLYPAWAYSIPAAILKIPFSFIDAFLWTALTYYVIGYSPEPERFFRLLFLLFLVHQMATSLFRLIASVVRDPPFAANFSLFILMVIFLFSGFIIPRPLLPAWVKWGFWLSPLAYSEIGVAVNEFLAPRWQEVSYSNSTLGQTVLEERGLNFKDYYYWISVGALIGFWLIFNIGFTLALSLLKSPGSSRAIISYERFSYLKAKEDSSDTAEEQELPSVDPLKAPAQTKVEGMVLPFKPITISFEDVQYFVDTPKKLREHGCPQRRLQLLRDITGAFRPGVLTALMGVSGAGKTTLMDVLSGRKTGGYIEGEIRIGGYPKVQETYARISAYCEQTDIHSSMITVEESVMYSAWLRLPTEIDKHKRLEFVAEVLQMIELYEIKDSLVGIPRVSGISPEQRKRLTIAVELVSNPSIIFMDEPTSGLDARAAAIVMRVVKNIVDTNRTIVCTIHQPSIDIFEAFDELILMKKGGQMIYSGELGQHSSRLIEYFEGIPGVPKIKENYNPATWMLEVTNPSAEARLRIDFACIYKESYLYKRNKEIVKSQSLPPQGSEKLQFSTPFPQNEWEQLKACLWKQHLSYWRSPKYNLTRLAFVVLSSLLYGALLWQKGQNLHDEQDFFNIMGSMYVFVIFTGVSSCSSLLPFVATQRIVVYRERFARMYSSWAYSLAQVIIEIPYIFLEAILFSTITYPAVNFYGSTYKVFWYFYTMFCTLLYYKYLGMMLVSLTPTYQVATIFASLCYTLFSLFSGYLIPGPRFPKWWIWGYWICPTSWSLKGFLTSQYGDIKEEIVAFGERKTLSAFLDSQYGYKYQDLPIIAIVLFAFPLVFALVFTYGIAKLNYQRR
ncbi:polar auxin transport inhibitor sensitive 1, PLEIOTROPIC DRUG RESISTANCE 9 [Hibiscus trionum]|uniref:Polar auxin transport inhibitor sensitive 1, PLEIOTROPIC DRUG RESISTANCE 9 n=1 Tax=Hibiscus trionum TaxID=183268 RepID=A0A9W7JCN9_HIBTR|nr:polar auxin transport inhibitor sensitive 1, PLEIOTROPIC DRUG RESISTANCE 9 [Hibiscus trionum]